MTEILGQDKALARLKRMLETKKVPSALLFYGPEGVGKRRAARWFAGQLNGRADHPSIVEVDDAFQAAVLDVEAEKIRSIRVDTVRELTRRASLKADAGIWKVFLLDKAETLETEAANALLKELEEPEPNTVWILVSARRERLLPTILSRCQSVPFAPLSAADLRAVALKEGIADAEALARWGEPAHGSLDRLARLMRYGALAEDGRRDPGAYWAVAQGLGRDLAVARETAEGVIDALLTQGRNQEKLLRLKRSLRSNVSPQLIVQLAFLESK